MPAQPPQQPQSPQGQPRRRHKPSGRGGSRPEPGSDTVTERPAPAGERRARRQKQPADTDRAASGSPERAATATAVDAAQPADDTAASAEVSEEAEAAASAEVSEEADAAESAEVSGEPAEGTRSGPAEKTEAAESPQQRARREQRERQERRRERREDHERRERRLVLRSVAIGFVAVVLGGLAAWFGVEAHSVTSTPAASNSAFTDTAANSAVRGQVTSAVKALFSYNYAKPGPTTQAEHRLLTGAGTSQYSSVFGEVLQEGPSQKLTIATAVTNAGVESLTGDQARLLIFAKTDERVGTGAPQAGTAILAVSAVRQGGTWKIDGIDAY